MILGFSHAMIGCYWSGGFKTHCGVPSSSEKWPFLANPAKSHDIVVGFPGLVPLELVRHDTGVIRSRPKISIKGRGYIEVYARMRYEEIQFLSMFGELSNHLISVRSPVTNWKVDIAVVYNEDAPINPPMDLEGCAALAFLSSDVEADLDEMVERGCKMASNPFAVRVNGRDMLVALGRSPDGTIVELVQIRS